MEIIFLILFYFQWCLDPTTVVPSKGYSEEEEIGLISGSENIGQKPAVNKPQLEAVPPLTSSENPGTQPTTFSINQSSQQSSSTPSSEKQPQFTNNTPDKPTVSTGTVSLAPVAPTDGNNTEAENKYLAPDENEPSQPIPVPSQLLNEGKVEPGKLTVETVLDYLAPQNSGSFQGISAISSDINYTPPNEDGSIEADNEDSKVGKNNNQDSLPGRKPSGNAFISTEGVLNASNSDKENDDDLSSYNPSNVPAGLGVSTTSDNTQMLTDDNLETYKSSVNQPKESFGNDQEETEQNNKDSDGDTTGEQEGNRKDINQDQNGSSDLSSYQSPSSATSLGSTVDESKPIQSLEAYGVGSETAEVSDQEAESEDTLMLDMKDMKEFKV